MQIRETQKTKDLLRKVPYISQLFERLLVNLLPPPYKVFTPSQPHSSKGTTTTNLRPSFVHPPSIVRSGFIKVIGKEGEKCTG